MNDYVLTCCSTADLSRERFADRNIQVVYFHFMIGNEDYLDDCGESVPPAETKCFRILSKKNFSNNGPANPKNK